jgi:hypothetical protein
MRISFPEVVALLAVAGITAGNSAVNNSDSLKIWVEPGSSPNQFRIVIANISRGPVRIWKEQCSWGYEALALEVKSGDELPKLIKPRTSSWRRNLPQFRTLEPGEKYTLNYGADDWPGLLTASKQRLQIRAHYTVRSDEDATRANVWTGHVQSEWTELELETAGQK